MIFIFFIIKEKCLVVKRKELDNQGLLIIDLYLELCFSMMLSISCNPQSENNGFKKFVILNRT